MNLHNLVGYLQRVKYENNSLGTHAVSKLDTAAQQAINIGSVGGHDTLTAANDGVTLDLLASFYFCNLNYGDYINVTLPTPSNDNAGNPITFIRTDPDSSESQITLNGLFYGGDSYILSFSGQTVTIVSDGNYWFIVYQND